MELTKEVIREVLSERAGYRLGGTDDQPSFQKQPQYLDAAVKEAEIFLSNGISVDIRVFLGYADCEAKHPLSCKALCEVEVWTLHIQSNRCDEQMRKPSMLPMFLKQAIRSQLFFSSLKSWFAEANNQIENFPCRFRCLYKISANSHFHTETEIIGVGSVEEHHKFPPCKIDARTTLNIQVKWLKKRHFPTQLLGCPNGAENGQFVYPLDDIRRVPKESMQSRKSVSRESSADVRRKNTQVPDVSSNLTRAELNVVTLQKMASYSLTDSSGNIKRKNSSYRLLSDLSGLHSLVKPPTARNDAASQGYSPNQSPCSKKLKELGEEGSTVKSEPFTLNCTPNGRRVLRENNNRRKVAENVGVSKLRDSLHSSPVPFARRQLLAERSKLQSSPNKFTSNDVYDKRNPRRSGLLCNFEESMLKGRISPIRSVEGFKLQLAVLGGSFSMPHVEAETTVHYFNEEAAPSLFMSCCNISKFTNANKAGLQIPKRCTVQAVLFNPQGSVVKLFLVHVDVSDIPPQSQTFIRQRTVSISSSSLPEEAAKKESIQNKNQQILLNKSPSSKTTISSTGSNETDNGVSENLQSITGSRGISARMSTTRVDQCGDNLYSTSQSPVTNNNSVKNDNGSHNENNIAKTSSSLKFLIHLRIASDHRNRVFLHGDIKMLLSNKGGDLEGLVFSQTQSTTQMPQCPKYSPTKI